MTFGARSPSGEDKMTNHRKTDYRLRRLDANRLELPNDYGIPVRIFANDGVPIERAAVDELLGLLELQETIARMLSAAPELFDGEAYLEAVSLSSDFHRGAGIPIGTTLKTRGVAVATAPDATVGRGALPPGVLIVRLPEDAAAQERVRALAQAEVAQHGMAVEDEGRVLRWRWGARTPEGRGDDVAA